MRQLSLLSDAGERSEAVISDCGTYRYTLSREWGDPKRRVLFCGLNPSIADANIDDNTVRRWRKFAQSWGYGAFDVVNLYAFRATDPKQLLEAPEPVGHENSWWLSECAGKASLFVACWGNPGAGTRADEILSKIEHYYLLEPHALAVTKLLQPQHVLYLSGELTPRPLRELVAEKTAELRSLK